MAQVGAAPEEGTTKRGVAVLSMKFTVTQQAFTSLAQVAFCYLSLVAKDPHSNLQISLKAPAVGYTVQQVILWLAPPVSSPFN